ncbi:hypothetical protein BK826_08050 [Rothia kristinae]|uniref:Uncharacterized protein n=1 Tax=Rothia kristinae TaxID=37923 RepID=A0A1S2MZ94_9MICC|nr:hypothetical protein [Rothia kristinae]OIJ35433.1 hypothetical protein BK826_08050 [Rothia kristinae]
MSVSHIPRVSRDLTRESAQRLRELASVLDGLSDDEEAEWGLRLADVGIEVVATGEVLADSGVAVAALEGASLRAIGDRLGIAFSALPRRIAGTPELGDYAEASATGHPRVTQGGIERARYDLRHGQFTVEGEPERVQKRRRRG